MDSFSQTLVYMISILDTYGASEWNTRAIAATSAIFFLGIRHLFHKKRGIDWDAAVHAIITGVGSACCIYLSSNAASHLSGVSEPIGSLECARPLTSLHRIIPAITQGYALCDIIQGFHLLSTGLGPEFIAHGVATFTVTTIFNEYDAPHLLTPVFVMEGSTIVLSFMRADFLSDKMRVACQFLFFLLFFITRIVIFPMVIFQTIPLTKDGCFAPIIFYTCVLFGVFFNCLNVFWFIKMVKKVHRKFTGKESYSNTEKD